MLKRNAWKKGGSAFAWSESNRRSSATFHLRGT